MLLKSALNAMGISPTQFASRIGVCPESVMSLIREESEISPRMAARLSKTIPGPDAATWLRMQAEYDDWLEQRQKQEAAQR